MTSHPKDLSENVIRLIGREDKLANYIHLPVQSGSDTILKKMNRGYDSASYLKKIDAVREHIPGAGITSDIIVGFPTETEEDFRATLALVEKVRYNNLFMFIYSKRAGTPAAAMDGQIPEDVKKARIAELIGVQAKIANELAEEHIGLTCEALCDGRGRRATAKTSDDRVIVFDDEGRNLYNEFVTLEITAAENSKLYGRLRK